MKTVMYGKVYLTLPNMDSSSGMGMFAIGDELYHEYQLKLLELLKLAEQVKQIAANQNIQVD